MAVIALAAGALSLYLANGYINSVQDESAKASVAAGEITLFGTIFAAFYKEVDTYYGQKNANVGRKWDLIFPMLKKYYYPLTQIAMRLKGALEWIDPSSPTDPTITRYLYLTMVFYGIHQRFTNEEGGLILLSSTADEKAVQNAYLELQIALDWAGDETPKKVSYLQSLWMKKTAPSTPAAGPYLLSGFSRDLENDDELKKDREIMKEFFQKNKDYKTNALEALDKYISTFEKSMDRLYNAWSES